LKRLEDVSHDVFADDVVSFGFHDVSLLGCLALSDITQRMVRTIRLSANYVKL